MELFSGCQARLAGKAEYTFAELYSGSCRQSDGYAPQNLAEGIAPPGCELSGIAGAGAPGCGRALFTRLDHTADHDRRDTGV